ncbi:DinB family protein [Solitalea sp. MAHUQ-68]|uniref:DinB family protein n=1 Tax=Solitalea agri TaxID=2953739 RepID=A0A9X2JFR5_9SPHI|nr:DinB family protein [Solitalea agri]MCO4293711.1 DinB family protein [Solitalea agri]
MKLIFKPTNGYPSFYQPYLDLVPNDGKLLFHLSELMLETEQLLINLPETRLQFRYSEGKWTIKDILVHLCDSERIIIFRASRIARGDKTNLPGGWDGELFVRNAKANERPITGIFYELKACRNASIAFIETLDNESLARIGISNDYEVSALYMVNHLYGHHMHHLNIIKERYLNF